MRKKILLAVILSSLIVVPTVSAQNFYPKITTIARQLLVIDLNTRMVLSAKSANERMYPASMTKVMTAYIVFEHLKNNFIDADTEFFISYKARQMKGSRMFVEQGTKVTIEELLYGLVVQSGNDAAVALAEGISGSEESFVQLMNDKARELGMTNTHYTNSSGWPDKEHYTTAFDLAILAKHTMEDFPRFYKIYAEREYQYNKITQKNRNPLLWSDLGVNGLKTGHTEASGYGLLAAAEHEGRRVILVINGLPSERSRHQESIKILRWAFSAWENVTLYDRGEKIIDVAIILGVEKMVSLLASQPIEVTVPRRRRPNLTSYIEYKSPLVAPVNKGDVLGVMIIKENEEEILRSPAIAGTDIAKTGFFGRLSFNLLHLF